jgi:membrane protein implicated in regulation of membrane protease activity
MTASGTTINEMTSTQPPQPKTRRTFFNRRFAPLIATWIAAVVAAALVYWFETAMPAFHEVLLPFYAIIATLAVFFTWRWIRTRGKGERRHRERRRTDRRETSDQPTTPREY